MEWWLSLLSGLIGAVIGGLLSLLGSLWASDRSERRTEERDKRLREREQAARRDAVLRAFLAEASLNGALLERHQIAHAKVLLETTAWRAWAGELPLLDAKLQGLLHTAYGEVFRYNDLVSYDRVGVSPGHGMLDRSISEHAATTRDRVMPVVEALMLALK